MPYRAGDIIPRLCRVPETVLGDVEEGVCCLCGHVGYVVPLSLNLTNEDELAFREKYQRQKPVRCQNPVCARTFCQNCVAKYRGLCSFCGNRVDFL